MPLITDAQEDACTPTKEQLTEYLATPDDTVAAKIRNEYPDKFVEIGRSILYGKNIAKAQRDADLAVLEAERQKLKIEIADWLKDNATPIYSVGEAKNRSYSINRNILDSFIIELRKVDK
jgi:hypothetical protein